MEIEGEMIHRCPIALIHESPTAGAIASFFAAFETGNLATLLDGQPTAALSEGLAYLHGEVGRRIGGGNA